MYPWLGWKAHIKGYKRQVEQRALGEQFQRWSYGWQISLYSGQVEKTYLVFPVPAGPEIRYGTGHSRSVIEATAFYAMSVNTLCVVFNDMIHLLFVVQVFVFPPQPVMRIF